MLAIVHHLAGAGMLIGRGAPAEEGSALEQRNFVSGVGQRTRSRESGESATNDAYAGCN
jgi:hypothetical protein